MNKPATLVGTAIGDALGLPHEKSYKDRANRDSLDNWNGEYSDSSYHGTKAGQWSDDTQMSIALAQSLIANGEFDPKLVAKAYRDWLTVGCPLGKFPRGIGNATKEALYRLDMDVEWQHSGTESRNPGSGTAMRISPVGIFYDRPSFVSNMNSVAMIDATITHKNPEASAGSVIIANAIVTISNLFKSNRANNKFKDGLLFDCALKNIAPFGSLNMRTKLLQAAELLKSKMPVEEAIQKLGNSGTVWECVPTALYAFSCEPESFTDTVFNAIRGGGDTDTRGAIAGALSGTYNGLKGIPTSLFVPLESRELLLELDEKLNEFKFIE